MANLKKRTVKIISSLLVSIMSFGVFAPSAALAYYPYYDYGYRYHHWHDSHWTSRDTAVVAGVAGLAGIIALINNAHKSPPKDPAKYEVYRDQILAKLSAKEMRIYNNITAHPAGNYRSAYSDPDTPKIVKKLAKKLPYDVEFVRKDEAAGYVYFNIPGTIVVQ